MELRERIEKIIDDNNIALVGNVDNDFDTTEFVDSILAAIGNKWVKCSDRLPEEQDFYLCFCNASYDKMRKLLFNTNKQAFVNGESYKVTTITHWMPLPNKPEEV
jgi:hypothetical protein